jgi:hypothetical protein
MRQASKRIPESAEKTVRDIRRATRRAELPSHRPSRHRPRAICRLAAEPLAMCYPALAGDTLRGWLTPRFRTIHVCPKGLAGCFVAG